MCPANDFAFNCDKEKLTFFYYNALPQTPNLNRGCWKHRETEIRKDSQNDSLLIICGGFAFNTNIGNTRVPDFCFKIIKNLKNLKIECYIYNNSDNSKEDKIELKSLLDNISYSSYIKDALNLK